MALVATNVQMTIQSEDVIVTWDAGVLDTDGFPTNDVTSAWVLQDVLHAGVAPVTVPGDARSAIVFPARCEWSAYVLYQTVSYVDPDTQATVTIRSRLSEPSVTTFVSCGPACRCVTCTQSVTFLRHGASFHRR
jgi:hypothetical protein